MPKPHEGRGKLGRFQALGALLVVMSSTPDTALAQKLIPADQRQPIPSALQPIVARVFDSSGADVVVLDLWGSWCSPCVDMHAGFQQLLRTYGSVSPAIVGVAWDTPARIDSFYAVHGQLGYPTVVDSAGTLIRSSGYDGLPVVMLVSRQGLVAWERKGGFNVFAVLPPLFGALRREQAGSSARP